MTHETFFNLNAEKRGRIVESAIDEFLRTSYEKTSIDRIVKSAGIPKGSFYQYFDSKDDLYVYCIMDLASTLLAQSVKTQKRGILENIFKSANTKGLTATILAAKNEQIALIGEKNYKFCLSLIDAPHALKNDVLLRIAKELIKPIIKEELARDKTINKDFDLDYFAYIISLAEFISIQYDEYPSPSITRMNKHSYEYILAIYSFLSAK
ncbi:MAG: TetR/AcrR family transcriptional regulator [Clostridiales bacterium]|jgi:AcrR family transcriptional regulator|nr:TetR/AcrR family transcriptional regulator [Clostridiales bacterium]